MCPRSDLESRFLPVHDCVSDLSDFGGCQLVQEKLSTKEEANRPSGRGAWQ